MFPLRIELGTFRVLSGCDNHYTTETVEAKGIYLQSLTFYYFLFKTKRLPLDTKNTQKNESRRFGFIKSLFLQQCSLRASLRLLAPS